MSREEEQSPETTTEDSREETLESLMRSEETARVLLNAMDFTAMLVDPQGRILAVNDAACRRLGKPREELIGLHGREIQPTGISRAVGQKAVEVITTGKSIRFEYDDGKTFYQVSLHPILNPEGKVECVAAFTRDITESVLTEQALRESEQRYRSLVEMQGEGIGIVDLEERFTFANPAAHQIFGVPEGALVGRSLVEFTDPESFRQVEQETRKRQSYQESIYELEFERADGERRTILVSAAPQYDASGEVVGSFGVFRDITEMKVAQREKERLEAQLGHAQKMETAGRLAGGVAHDFNNLLTVIQGSAEMLMMKLVHDDPLMSLVQEILEASDRAGSLTRQLLAFSRRQVLEPVVLDPVRVIRLMEKMIRRLIGEHIEVVIRADPEVGNVRADRGQLEQVIINLAVNARDAMLDGGRLDIVIDTEVVGEEQKPPVPEMPPGAWVRVTFSDTGVGMSAEVLDRIFEPFFTTKEKSRGTGLGLSMVYGIVKQSDGHVRVRSFPSEGTTFDIYLPEVHEAPAVRGEEDGRKSDPPLTATILVVEDDAGVRRLARQILQARGFTVIEASRDTEALRVLENHQGPVDMALMDVVLPGRTGPQVASMLREVLPDLRVLYMSGYPDDAIDGHGVLGEGTHFIAKPFSTAALVRKVREILEDTS